MNLQTAPGTSGTVSTIGGDTSLQFLMFSTQNRPFILWIINHYTFSIYVYDIPLVIMMMISQEKFAAPTSMWQVVKRRTSPCAASPRLLRFFLFVCLFVPTRSDNLRQRISWSRSLGTRFKTNFEFGVFIDSSDQKELYHTMVHTLSLSKI